MLERHIHERGYLEHGFGTQVPVPKHRRSEALTYCDCLRALVYMDEKNNGAVCSVCVAEAFYRRKVRA
jgi:hypothetical protein